MHSAEPQATGESAVDHRGVLAYMARNPVAANLLMLALCVGGLMMIGNVRQEVFPDVAPEVVVVSVPYPGASPSEVEQGVILAIEEALSSIEGIKRVTATASEGVASVSIELMDGELADDKAPDVQSAIDRITSFPLDAERPTVSAIDTAQETASIIFYGDVDERVLRQVAEGARDQLLQDDRITDVRVTEVRPLEISVEVPEEELRAHNLTLETISSLVGAASVEIPAGAIDAPSGEVLLRTSERRDLGAEFEEITVLARADGTRVQLGDIATVIDGFQDTNETASFNGKPASRVRVFRAGDQTPIELSDAIYEYLDTRSDLPPGVEASVWFDRSESYRDRVQLLLKNAYLGLCLVLVVLGLFLEIRLAFWVTLGIPISFLGSILLMPSMDVSFNMISLFAFILTLGIVVDDAIVVGEAVYHRQQQGLRGLDAAVAGVKDVASPVIFSVLTTMIAFIPLLLIPGTSGRFIRNIPTVVIAVFALSLVESLLILPAHLSHQSKSQPNSLLGLIKRAQQAYSRWFDTKVVGLYRRTALPLVQARYLTLAASFGALLLSVGLIGGGYVKFTYMPKVEGDIINAAVRMPFGTPPELTEQIVDRMVREARAELEAHGGDDIVRGIYATVGGGAESFGPSQNSIGGGHLGNVALYLVPIDDRPITTAQLASAWRNRIGEVPGAEQLSITFNTGPSAGSPISVRLSHSNVASLESAAVSLAEHLATYDGVIDIDSGVALGKEQIDLELTEEGRAHGLTEVDLARQVRAAFFGAEAVRQQRGRDELRVYVRRPLAERQSEYYLEQMMVRTPDGGEIPLQEAAKLTRGRAYTSIDRINSRRVITVTADVEEEVANAAEVAAALDSEFLPSLAHDVPGLSYEFAGEQEDRQQTVRAIGIGMAAAIGAMFCLMAVAFKSYLQPIIILSAIPFGLVGAVLGHVLMGYSVSMLSMFGMVALAGVVVNDSLILVVAVNEMRDSGQGLYEAVVEGGARRFRPILMTSFTTFFGLFPMILETSVQARFLIPMAISLGFGVLFVTFITLVLVPSLYMAIEDVRRLLRRAFGDDEGHGAA